MLNKVLEIAEENRYLSLNRGFVVIKNKDETLASIPLCDIAVLLLSAQSVTVTKNILNALSERGCVTILCGKNYLPQSIVLPESSHYLFSKIIKTQINASLPFKKRVWQQVVAKKIHNQALALKFLKKEKESLSIEKISKMVDSGDSKNREAYAAKMYWKFLFGKDFVRDKCASGINSLLNYGYAIMRAAMARAICAAGLMPSLGIHHENNLNQFCLVDDLFEIYRPLVDLLAFKLFEKNQTELVPETKKIFSKALQIKLRTTEGLSPAVTSMKYVAFSYVRALEAKKPLVELPFWEENEDGITVIE